MALRGQALSRVLIVVIFALIIIAAFGGVYFAGLLHFGKSSKKVELIGVCNATTYLLPDTMQILVTNVTVTSSNTTTYYLSTYSTITATTETQGITTYTTTLTVNSSTSYVITNSTNLNPYSPSANWAVSTCTFAP